jgi:hypothetical protein
VPKTRNQFKMKTVAAHGFGDRARNISDAAGEAELLRPLGNRGRMGALVLERLLRRSPFLP